MENGPFLDGLPTKNGPFSSIFHGYVSQNQMVSGWMENTSSIDPKSHRIPRNWAPRRAEGDGAILPNGRHPGGRNVLPVVPNGLREEKHGKTGGLQQVDNFPIYGDLRIRDDLPMTFIFEVRDSKNQPCYIFLQSNMRLFRELIN